MSCYGWKWVPSGAIEIEGKYYKAFTDERKDFFSALATCNENYGTLIEFRDQSEANALEVMRREYVPYLQAALTVSRW